MYEYCTVTMVTVCTKIKCYHGDSKLSVATGLLLKLSD